MMTRAAVSMRPGALSLQQGQTTASLNAGMTSNEPWWLTMPLEELAATILPLFPSSFTAEGTVMRGIMSWTGQYREPGPLPPSLQWANRIALSEAIQVLEHARLVIRFLYCSANSRQVWFNIGLTRLGFHVLQTTTVRRHLGLGDAPPTA